MKNLITTTTRHLLSALATFLLIASVTSASASPIPGISVIVKKNPGGIVFRATTNGKGKFTINNLEAGTYSVDVTAIGMRGGSKTFKPYYLLIDSDNNSTLNVNGRIKAKGSKVTISVTADTTIEITLLKPGTISGLLTEDKPDSK